MREGEKKLRAPSPSLSISITFGRPGHRQPIGEADAASRRAALRSTAPNSNGQRRLPTNLLSRTTEFPPISGN
jgi:hypothetical protein